MRSFLLPIAAIAVMAPGALMAQDAASGVALSAIIQAFEARGYEVTSADVEGSRIEIEATKPDGARVEAIVERATGAVLDERADD